MLPPLAWFHLSPAYCTMPCSAILARTIAFKPDRAHSQTVGGPGTESSAKSIVATKQPLAKVSAANQTCCEPRRHPPLPLRAASAQAGLYIRSLAACIITPLLSTCPRHRAQQLHKLVDGFTVMTYDASRPERPGFNAPLPWVENNVRLLIDADHAVEQRAKVEKLDEEPEPCASTALSPAFRRMSDNIAWLGNSEQLHCSAHQDIKLEARTNVWGGRPQSSQTEMRGRLTLHTLCHCVPVDPQAHDVPHCFGRCAGTTRMSIRPRC